MKHVIQILLILIPGFFLSQIDSTSNRSYTKRINIGIVYDIKNSNAGFSISNGVDLEPLIHFEDFSADFRYKVEFITNFNRNFEIESYFGYNFPRRIFLKEIGIDSKYLDFQNNLKLKKIGIVGKKFVNPIQTVLFIKPAFQQLNNNNNWGFEFGGQKSIIYKKLFSEFSAGYYFKYWSYSLLLQSLIIKDEFGINASFEKISKYEFVKIGLNYQIVKRNFR